MRGKLAIIHDGPNGDKADGTETMSRLVVNMVFGELLLISLIGKSNCQLRDKKKTPFKMGQIQKFE